MSSLEIANRASLQAFANCYLREVDAGVWFESSAWQEATGVDLLQGETHVVELKWGSEGQVLALGVRHRSRVGPHVLTTIHERAGSSSSWRLLDGLSAQLRWIESIYAKQPESEQRLELIHRVVESHQVMSEYLRRRESFAAGGRSAGAGDFIESEQSTILGHWLHPTPKSRQGIFGWQHGHYAPELAGRFQLHFFAAPRRLVQQDSLLSLSAEEISRNIASAGPRTEKTERLLRSLGSDFCLLPVHPLQAQWLLHQAYVRELLTTGGLVDLGPLGPRFTPTSSVRTVYSEEVDYMLKLSIPVKITNSLRINLQSELGDSVGVSRLLRAWGVEQAFPCFRTLEDPAYISLAVPEMEESGFEVIFRSNPFTASAPKSARREAQAIAALVQEPLHLGERSRLAQLVHRFAEIEGLPIRRASSRWFEAYWRCAVETVIRIYDKYGIALEAHQQNSLLSFDESGAPEFFYYRDIQGLALSESSREEHLALVPELVQQHKLFEPDDIVRNGFGYYLFFNQLYAVIHRFALDGLLEEESLLTIVRDKLVHLKSELVGLGAAFVETILRAESLPCKANLLTRIEDVDELQTENELAIYNSVTNPLVSVPGIDFPPNNSSEIRCKSEKASI